MALVGTTVDRSNTPLRAGARTARWRRGLAAALAAAALLLAPDSSPARQPLDRDVTTAFSSAKMGRASVGVCIVDVQTGQMLAGLNERQAFIPASNHKLLTSGVALLVLGSDYQFTTRLLKDGDRLIIEGSGDPGFADPKLLDRMNLTLPAFVDRLVDQAKAQGTTGIREVIVDDRVFERTRVHPSWPKDQLNLWYCAPVSGLNFYTNCVEIYAARGSKAGSPPTWRTVPSASWLEVVNKARTVDDGQTAIGAVRDGDSTRFTLSGTVRATPDGPIEVTMGDPGLMFGRVLADRLAAAGLSASPGVAPSVRLAGEQDAFPRATAVASVATDILTALSRCNVDSQNLYAESLFKAAGHKVSGQPGSWSNGATVMRMVINDRLGVDSGALVVADGSGLSRDNRVSPLLMANWLVYLARQPDAGPKFLSTMAESDDGKLKARFKDERLRNHVLAKTGYIRGVSCLSGYVTSTSGRTVAFSVLVNNTDQGGGTAKAKDFHDDVVALIDRWVTKQDNAQNAAGAGGR